MALAIGAALASCSAPGSGSSSPKLCLIDTLRTTPFAGTEQHAKDAEGSALVRNHPEHPNVGGTDSLWIVEDGTKTAWEIDPETGTLKASIGPAEWGRTCEYDESARTGAGSRAGRERYKDLESMAYDAKDDVLYAFSGSNEAEPTVFRLERGADGTFRPESWRALPDEADHTAAAWNPGDERVYVCSGRRVAVYDFDSNETRPVGDVRGLAGVYGMAFSSDGRDLFAVTSSSELVRVDWSRREVVDGWVFDLEPLGVRDPRAVEIDGDRFLVCDGSEDRAPGDRLRYAVFVLAVHR